MKTISIRPTEPSTSDPAGLAAYGLVNAGAHYMLLPKLELVAQLTNVFNKRYDTAAQLGPTVFHKHRPFHCTPFPAV